MWRDIAPTHMYEIEGIIRYAWLIIWKTSFQLEVANKFIIMKWYILKQTLTQLITFINLMLASLWFIIRPVVMDNINFVF